jgi:2'-5' RNA ligase
MLQTGVPQVTNRSMDGIVSILGDEHGKWVQDIWAELDHEFGLRGIYVTPFPHITYHVAEHYEVEQIGALLKRFASEHTRFTVRTAGLGIFTGANPVVYIPVVRSPQLSRFHRLLWDELGDAGLGVNEHYQPEGWVPHVTLAIGDVDSVNLPHVIRHLAKLNLYWEFPVHALSLVYSTGTEYGLRSRLDFPLSST